MAKQNIKAISNNDLELVKAAAWAWYHHGSNSDGKPITTQEFDVTRTRRSPKPTRYKLEATRNNNSNINNNNIEIERGNKYSLLDAYEIESISKRLDHLVESSGIKFYKELLKIDTNIVDDRSKNKRSGSSKLKRFMLRRGVVCGRSHDVDEMAFEPKKHAVIKRVMLNPKVI